MVQYLSTTFIAGILALLPLLITVAVAFFVYSKLLVWLGPESRFGSLPKLLAKKMGLHPVLAYCCIFAVVALAILGIGALAKRSTEKRITQLVDRIPILRVIYGGTAQVVNALQVSEGGMPRSFSKVVVAKIADASVLGVLASPKTVTVDGEEFYSVYYPNAPIPAAGQVYLGPVANVRPVDMTVEELMQIYVSMGSLMDETVPLGDDPARRPRMLPQDTPPDGKPADGGAGSGEELPPIVN